MHGHVRRHLLFGQARVELLMRTKNTLSDLLVLPYGTGETRCQFGRSPRPDDERSATRSRRPHCFKVDSEFAAGSVRPHWVAYVRRVFLVSKGIDEDFRLVTAVTAATACCASLLVSPGHRR